MIAAVGAVRSAVIDNSVAEVLLFPAVSIATDQAIFVVTAPLANGVTTRVYVSPSTAVNVPFVPFTTTISVLSNPVTVSLN